MFSKSAPDQSEAHPPPSARRPWSLAARLTLWYGASSFALVSVAAAFLYWALVTNLDREDDEFLADKVRLVQTLLREQPDDTRMLKEEVEWEPAARGHAQVYVRVLNPDQTLIMETPGMSSGLPGSVFPGALGLPGETPQGAEVSTRNGSYRLLAAAADWGPSRQAIVQVALDRTREADLLAGYRRALWLTLGFALAGCIVAGHSIARRGVRPIAAIVEAARRTRSTTLNERINTQGFPAELATLAATFNEMLDRLEEAFERLGRFAADIAHELRTPVNNLRGEAEVALGRVRTAQEYREALGSCLEECSRLTRLIDSLLFIARAESPETQIAREMLNIGQELDAVKDYYEAPALEAGVSLTVMAPADLTARIDRTLFHRALGNLIANALAHTPAGGHVSLGASQEPEGVRVDVIDSGEGIAAEHLPHVFDRFYRADNARSTASAHVGLGLPIVQTIARLHEGSATLASEVGKGTRVSLMFPRTQGGTSDGEHPSGS
jgi:two-component system heavy metal sensor histidine kinase CusS